MRFYILILLAASVCTGCAQMKYSGRYQEVRIESEPSGAKVLVEGKIDTLKPAAVKASDGTMLAYHSPMQLTTPVVVILDKECEEYTVRMAYEGFPEYEKPLLTRFAFHPFLIITFPVVPFWSKYEIQRFDDIFVDFAAYKAELEDLKLGKCKAEIKDAQEILNEKTAALEMVLSEISAKEKELGIARKEVVELTGKQLEMQKAISEAETAKKEGESEEAEKEAKEEVDIEGLNSEIEEVNKALEQVQKEVEKFEKELDELRSGCGNLEKEKTAAQERLNISQTRCKHIEKEMEEERVDSSQGESEDKSSEQ